MDYVLYTRCSTNKQLNSIAEQTQAANRWLQDTDTIVEHFSEVESGRKVERIELANALDYCQDNNATLLISRLDRLSRNAAFTMSLSDSGVSFIALDAPNANKLTIGVMALLAQDYAEKVSLNTKKTLSYLKSQGVVLGKPENLTHGAQIKGAEATKENARKRNHQTTKIIIRLRADTRTFKAIATELNADGYKTSTGKAFSKGTVKILHDRFINNQAA